MKHSTTHAMSDRAPVLSSLVTLFFTLLGLIFPALADVALYTHTPYATGGQYKSSWFAPDGFDDDQAVWDAFTLSSTSAITKVTWRGAYTNYLSNAGTAPVYNFTVSIFPSIPGNFQPDIVGGPLVRYYTNSNAGETPAGSAGGVAMYDYNFTLPSPFQAASGVKYWIYIQAWQGLTPVYHWPPDWSFARGGGAGSSGGDGSHFRRVGGTGGSYTYITGDLCFTLWASSAPTYTIDASAFPVQAGSISGTGAYPSASTATLIATPNQGFGFVRWTEDNTQVSQNPRYSFAVTRNRTLIAEFTPAYTITTAALPTYGGSVTGAGTFNQGSSVTVTATPNPGYIFSHWSWFGTLVSDSPVYTFIPTEDLDLTAEFINVPGGATFDFDDAPVHTSLPIALSSNGLNAFFTATGSGFSVQPVGSTGIAPAGMSGLYLYPNSVFGADLIINFSEPLTQLSIMYALQELACDDTATMRVTVYMDNTQVATNTARVPVPGTYPTGLLSITHAAGFNRAVIHYDSRPPTCQDYGIIFFADNLTVTRLCAPVTITVPPSSVTTCLDGSASFSITPDGSAPYTYQWQAQIAPDSWLDLTDGPWTFDGDTLILSGATSDVLQLSLAANPGAAALNFRCQVTNNCSTTTSDPASLNFCECTSCPADFNIDGGIDGSDIEAFFTAWELSACASDVNADGGVDGTDVEFFFLLWEAGGC